MPPYQLVWSNAPAGAHVLTAVVTDDLAATNLSAAVWVYLVDPSPTLTIRSLNSALEVSWSANAGPYHLETSTNLMPPISWSSWAEAPVLSNSQWRLSLPVDSQTQRFFRLTAP